MKIDFKYFAALIGLIIIVLFLLVLFDKISWETASVFAGPAIYSIYQKWEIQKRDEAFDKTKGISYYDYKILQKAKRSVK